jgi:hypothetical protein
VENEGYTSVHIQRRSYVHNTTKFADTLPLGSKSEFLMFLFHINVKKPEGSLIAVAGLEPGIDLNRSQSYDRVNIPSISLVHMYIGYVSTVSAGLPDG